METIKKIYKKYNNIVLFIIVNIITIFIAGIIKSRILVFGEDAFMQQLSTFLSNLIAIIIAYFLNRFIVFRTDKDFGDSIEEASMFIGLRIVTFFLSFAFQGLFINAFSKRISVVLSFVLVLILDYIFAKKIVFKD